MAIMPTNSDTEASAAASSTTARTMEPSREQRANIVPILFQSQAGFLHTFPWPQRRAPRETLSGFLALAGAPSRLRPCLLRSGVSGLAKFAAPQAEGLDRRFRDRPERFHRLVRGRNRSDDLLGL